MSDDFELRVPVPLVSDGFLRRECPTCEREFKWLSSEDIGEGEQPLDGGYFCPYCAIQAPPDNWFTKPQLALIDSTVNQQIIGPTLDQFGRQLRDIGRRSGGFLSVDLQSDEPEPVDPLTESDDMRRVDFACHPAEPVKVLEDWTQPVHCLICGRPADP